MANKNGTLAHITIDRRRFDVKAHPVVQGRFNLVSRGVILAFGESVQECLDKAKAGNF